MKYQEYLDKRSELLTNAQTATDEGDYEGAQALLDSVQNLDNDWDKQTAMEANMKALENNQRKVNINTMQTNVEAPVVDSTIPAVMTKEAAFKTEEYKNAWAKMMMGKSADMTADEAKAYKLVNAEGSASAAAYTHTTGNTGVLIPETVAAGIWREIGEQFPFYADTMKTFISGKAVMIISTSSTEAKWYVESVKTEDGKELFNKKTLNGCELARSISVSWLLKEMAVDEFIPFIQSQLAYQMGRALGYGVTHGAGVVSGHAPEPEGIITALEAESSTPQVVGSSSTTLSYELLIQGRAKVKAGYTPAIYVNSNIMWNGLAGMTDSNGRPLLMQDAINGAGAYRVLGCVVKEDDSLDDDEILFADAKQYQVNVNKQISLTTEEHNKERVTDYCAYAIVDGCPITTKAAALVHFKLGE